MSLKAEYTNEADIPETLKSLYKHEGDIWLLDVEGMVPSAKLDEFRANNRTLARERDEQLKPALRAYEDIGTVEDFKHLKEIREQLDEGKLIRSGKLEEAVEKRVQGMRADLETKAKKADEKARQLEQQLATEKIDKEAMTEAAKLGAKPSAMDDIVARIQKRFRIEDGKVMGYQPDGITRHYGKSGDGLTIGEVLSEMVGQAPHLFEESHGMQAEPGKKATAPRVGGPFTNVPNPWKKESHNLTLRMKIAKENPELAKRLRAEAGVVEVGSTSAAA